MDDELKKVDAYYKGGVDVQIGKYELLPFNAVVCFFYKQFVPIMFLELFDICCSSRFGAQLCYLNN